MTDIKANLRELTEPSREVDAEIDIVLHGSIRYGSLYPNHTISQNGEKYYSDPWDPALNAIPAYTSDLNVVIALVREKRAPSWGVCEVLPEAYQWTDRPQPKRWHRAWIDNPQEFPGETADGEHELAAVALLLALLEAMEVG